MVSMMIFVSLVTIMERVKIIIFMTKLMMLKLLYILTMVAMVTGRIEVGTWECCSQRIVKVLKVIRF